MKLARGSQVVARIAAFALVAALSFAPVLAAGNSGAELWHYDTGGPIWASLAYADGVLYVANDAGDLIAIDTARRQPRWRFHAAAAIRSRPALAGGRVFVTGDDGYLYALAIDTGAVVWRFDLESQGLCRREPKPTNPFFDYLQSSPVLDHGTVFVGAANGALYAVDAADGSLRWKAGTGDAIRGTPLVVDGRVVVGSWDHDVYAFDERDGKFAWRYDTGGIVQGTPAFVAGALVVGSRSARLFALEASSGQPRWMQDYPSGSWVESSAVVEAGQVLIGSSDALQLLSFDAATGKENWSFKTGGWTWATPLVAGDTVYVGSVSAHPYYGEGELVPGFFAVDRKTGQPKWHFSPAATQGYITGGIVASPIVADGVVYVGALDGKVYALRE